MSLQSCLHNVVTLIAFLLYCFQMVYFYSSPYVRLSFRILSFLQRRRHHSVLLTVIRICTHSMFHLWAKTIKKNTNSTQNKSQTHRAKQYEVTSFLSTDCELSTETCSRNVYSLGPRPLRFCAHFQCTIMRFMGL